MRVFESVSLHEMNVKRQKNKKVLLFAVEVNRSCASGEPSECLFCVVRYMYCDEISLTLQNAVQVLQGARKYQLNGLAERCLEFVENQLTDDGVCGVLEQALSIREQPLIDLCLRHVGNHTPAVFQSPQFLEVGPDVMEQVLVVDVIRVRENAKTLFIKTFLKHCKRGIKIATSGCDAHLKSESSPKLLEIDQYNMCMKLK